MKIKASAFRALAGRSLPAILVTAAVLLAGCGSLLSVSAGNTGHDTAASAVNTSSEPAGSTSSESAGAGFSFSFDTDLTISDKHPASAPERDALSAFFDAHGAAPLQDTEEDPVLLYGQTQPDPSKAACGGSLNYDGDGSTLLNAGFQVTGRLDGKEAEAYYADALALFFPEEDLAAWEDFLRDSFAGAGSRAEEHMYRAVSGSSEVILVIRPDDTAAPVSELMISL